MCLYIQPAPLSVYPFIYKYFRWFFGCILMHTQHICLYIQPGPLSVYTCIFKHSACSLVPWLYPSVYTTYVFLHLSWSPVCLHLYIQYTNIHPGSMALYTIIHNLCLYIQPGPLSVYICIYKHSAWSRGFIHKHTQPVSTFSLVPCYTQTFSLIRWFCTYAYTSMYLYIQPLSTVVSYYGVAVSLCHGVILMCCQVCSSCTGYECTF